MDHADERRARRWKQRCQCVRTNFCEEIIGSGFELSSDKLGNAEVPGLAAGRYTVRVSADSFFTFEAPLTLVLGESASLHTQLQVGAASQQIEVQESATGVDSERTEPSQVISPNEIQNLPILERNFIDLCC